ncbi:hypothetical protein G6M04_14585 [Agrobacterium rhizogenes]|uniref:hypothetical protein n=1 Tax=Rhizobium rhizogenes TaxID=359 RepID=UPI00157293B1|nr:hypothetical protein [Rhizobium rhizogenes]NTG48617.1 hypothetical protein [Rhizobium rhizogenes]
MTSTNGFIAELVRAANEVGRVSDFEKRRLLERAVIAIRDMREAVGIPESKTTEDASINLQTVAAMIPMGHASDNQVRSALIEAAGMIRDLHIVLDTKTEIEIRQIDR